MDRNEAIEIVREYYPSSGKDLNEALETLIPELKESEDERIIRTLKEIVNWGCAKNISVNNNVELKDCLAWLEKQGSQNLANSAKTCKDEQNQPTKYTLEQAARIFLDALSDTPYNNKPVTDAQVITRELLKFLSDAHSYNPNAINEQNPAWSEEDEKVLGFILTDLSYLFKENKKSTALFNIETKWLKSLKERCTWKPSDEQMKQLGLVVELNKGTLIGEGLMTLFNDLKRLLKI